MCKENVLSEKLVCVWVCPRRKSNPHVQCSCMYVQNNTAALKIIRLSRPDNNLDFIRVFLWCLTPVFCRRSCRYLFAWSSCLKRKQTCLCVLLFTLYFYIYYFCLRCDIRLFEVRQRFENGHRWCQQNVFISRIKTKYLTVLLCYV